MSPAAAQTAIPLPSTDLPVKIITNGLKNLNYTSKQGYGNFDTHFYDGQDEVSPSGLLKIRKSYREKSKYPDYLPTWDPTEKYGPLEFHEYHDPALRADGNFSNLFAKENVGQLKVKKITPKLGLEINGIQLTDLSDAAKDELALLVAQKGVVVFRNQNFADEGSDYVTEYGRHFGKLHIHQTSGHPQNNPELHITFRRPDAEEFARVFDDSTSSGGWHTDVSYELQPPSYTFFSVVEGPDGGGDTLFADTIEAFDRLSKPLQDFLSTLHVIHSSKEQAENSQRQGGIKRRAPVTHIHPLVRVHPVLKKKCLYVNRAFSRKIVELKRQESESLLNFLYNLVESSHDLQLRAKWEPHSVVIWDNRRVQHSAVIDWEEPIHRHAFRITPQAERPVADLKFLNDENYYPSSLTLDI
ncbi:BPK_HP2_G0032770.mRNA.1.CDS.1 [Saccharomyces cerevisiae]|nr:Jlp1p [Saccharomyces cerevisiae YJM1129]AJV68873.1 Jlp1p [Saccharomyces cerevisiae YJM1526]CAI5297457.1 AIF_HP2_G0033190.mRNA.1.CDS.1 [Saccharomyces cerevisiae]CAI5305863.1 BPK_HP2_G0032770.mRNA.1.CDS.1 [Saccharomyces cerevisiae]CAI6610808.1 AIF_HP1_G0031130.mRNA.1.CDS.1 [Saccharomyces cerevisiae]